jgi:hypothetical protein
MSLLRFVVGSSLVAVICAGCSPPHLEEPTSHIAPAPADGSFKVVHPYLRDRIRVLELGSPSFREATRQLRSGEVVVYVGTPATLRQQPIRREAVTRPMRSDRIAEFLGIGDLATGGVDTIVVSVDLDRIRLLHRPIPLIRDGEKLRRRIDRFVESILVHEIWGHVVPVAEAGNLSAHCPDPAPGEPAADSCVMRRENGLREELGWRPRLSYLFRS